MSATLTEKELAARWKLTIRTLQGWRSKGLGPRYVRLGERSIFYRSEDVEAYEKANVAGNPLPPEGWDLTVKRAAGALDVLAQQAKTQKAQATLATLRDDLRAIIP
ncbi:MAG: helix-turn-helix transcriptional regulator [Aestuariivirga sp.]